MKRVLSVILVCALLMAGLTTFVFADAVSISITTDKTTFEVGEEVTATVKLNGYKENTWSAITIAVDYDPDVLAYVSAESGLDASAGLVAEDKDGKVLLCWIAEKLPSHGDDGFLAKVHFEAIAETTNPVKIQSSFVADGIAAQGSTTPVDNTNGTVFNPAVQETPDVTITPVIPVDNSTITEATGSRQEDVTATYVIGQKADLYLIDIEWGALAFTYTDAKTEWDGEAYEWVPVEGEGAVPAVWTVDDENGDKITVTNHSSQPVDIEITSDKAAEGDNPRVTVDNGEFTLEVAPAGPDGTYNVATVNVGGTLSPDHVDGNPIATITVTIK